MAGVTPSTVWPVAFDMAMAGPHDAGSAAEPSGMSCKAFGALALTTPAAMSITLVGVGVEGGGMKELSNGEKGG